MREHDPESAQLEIEDEVGELQRPAEVRELEQQERGRAAETEPAEIGVVELRREFQVELSAFEHLDRDGGLPRRAADLGDEQLHLAWRRGVVLAHVRRRRDTRDAVVVSGAQEVEALGDRPHSVVDPRQKVRMEVDHDSSS